MPSSDSAGPLAAVRVIDLTQHLSGPFCTWTLATLGADVIKVESVSTGDGSRETPPFVGRRSIYFDSLNRGKRSIALDLKSARGQKILHDLVRNADVLVENFRPGVRARLGCADEALKQVNPDMIVCSISGFGQQGRHAKDPSYDIIVQAMSGMMSINGPVASAGMRVGFSIGDIAAGLFASVSVIAGLYARDAGSGKPARPIDISMLSCQLALLENAYARFLNAGEVPVPMGSRHPSMAPFESYTAADAVLVVGLGTNADWPRFCAAIEAPHLLADTRFATTPLRLEHRDALTAEIDRHLARQPRDYWLERLRAASIASGPQVTVPEFAGSDYAQEIGAFERLEAEGEVLQFVRHPLADPDAGDSRPAARLGQHTAELLRGLGYTESELETLQADGVIGGC